LESSCKNLTLNVFKINRGSFISVPQTHIALSVIKYAVGSKYEENNVLLGYRILLITKIF